MRFDSSGGHPYTGLFQGAEHGIFQMSSAFSPGTTMGIAPGMGMKFFRDGRPSANFVAMYKLQGQPCSEEDWFGHDWHNHVPSATGIALALLTKKFWQASSCPLQVGLSDLASTSDGPGKFPFMLTFHPLISVHCPCTDYDLCLSNLQKIPSGTKLFQVLATASPGADAQAIGYITTTSALTTSKFGDEQLLFAHQLMEADFQLEPTWLDQIDKKADCGMDCASTEAPTVMVGCTSPFGDKSAEMLFSDFTTV